MKRTKIKYEKLPRKVIIRGTGVPDLKAVLIKRTEEKALYKRDDNVFEVFYIKNQEAQEIFGKKYPAKEIYPNNEDFGKSAWCFYHYKDAKKRYDEL